MKIALCGSQGKMGTVFMTTFSRIYEIVEVNRHGRCLNDCIQDVDVVVDFTNSHSAFVHGIIALTHNKAIIIGSTGIREEHKATLQTIANERHIACILANNFSVGILWIQEHILAITDFFSSVQIYEQHHKSKLDSPSGTALALAKLLSLEDTKIHSLRTDSYDVKHTIVFENEDEYLKIEHIVKDRSAYMLKIKEYLSKIYTIKGYLELPVIQE